MERAAAGREVEQVREHQPVAVRQPHQALPRGAAERALADDRRALVALQRRGEELRADREVPLSMRSTTGMVIAPSPAAVAIASLSLPRSCR